MASRVLLAFFCVVCIFATVSAYAGEYIPKSYYIIANGHRSDPVYLRSKRSVLHLLRKKRSSNIPGVPSPDHFYNQAQDFVNKLSHGDFAFPGGFNPANFIPAQGAQGSGGHGYGSGSGSGAYSYSSASSSAGGGGGGQPQSRTAYSSGPSNNNHHYSNVGGDGPQVFSRFGEERGNNIHVSGSASGPNGAYSSSSASSDGTGKVRYSVQSGKY